MPCFISAGALSFGPHSRITVLGNCSLTAVASRDIVIYSNTSVTSVSVNMTAAGNITIIGTLTSSGLGPLAGVGAPSTIGQGASYGGSGGRAQCDGYFSNAVHQIGSINVNADWYLPTNINPTYGSGGGGQYGGRGGGRIILRARRSLNVRKSGSILATGSSASEQNYGGGSGGSIAIFAYNITLSGNVSVKGGDGFQGSPAGGGGRVLLDVSILLFISIICLVLMFVFIL
ncbi:hypothetical protein EON64_13745 [archaeon]|nr:MAG: hypothetical protein EON64_13745 [archaeon]